MIPVDGHKNLYRDENSGAILNTDSSGYNQYMQMKTAKLTQRDELDKIKADIDEIKLLLKQIINIPRS
tara:strand:- start:1668 stop:1871 length:204 start_codon:yes stop_codon:yes gene_type:complete